MSTLEEADKEVAVTAKGERVTLQDIENEIADTFILPGTHLHTALDQHPNAALMPASTKQALDLLTVAVVVTKDGFTVVGTSACADPANFNAELGAKLAVEDCKRKLWPLMGFRLRSKLAKDLLS